MLNLRRAILLLCTVSGAATAAWGSQTRALPSENPRFFYKGPLIADTTIPGEQKKDNAQPSNAVGWPLSRDRFLWIYVITTFQGPDSVRAIAYQIRRDAPDGPLVREAILSAADSSWEPFADGQTYFKQQGHSKVFGVPKGAVDRQDRLLPSQNVFCALWYQVARPIDRRTGRLLMTRAATAVNAQGDHESRTRLAGVQFRLNESGDDIVLLTPVAVQAERGFESGPAFCSLGAAVSGVNHWYTPLQPFNERCTQWVDIRHFYPRGIAPVLLEFNPTRGLYEWVRTGALTTLERGALIEGFVNRVGDEWIVGARGFSREIGTETVWFRTRDLFAGLGAPVLTPSPGAPHANRSAYVFGDGVLRIFGGNLATSPFKWSRNPQYCWDVNPKTFALSNGRTVLSTDDLNMAASNSVKFRTFLSPPFRNRQIATITVSKEIVGAPTPEDLAQFGVHYWYVTFDRDIEDAWRFLP